jgi:hypothetical protein
MQPPCVSSVFRLQSSRQLHWRPAPSRLREVAHDRAASERGLLDRSRQRYYVDLDHGVRRKDFDHDRAQEVVKEESGSPARQGSALPAKHYVRKVSIKPLDAWILRWRCVGIIAMGLSACTHSDFMPNVIQLTPNGTSANPAPESVSKSFTLYAVEDGYTGQFTAQTIVGECWVVQTPVSSGGAWTVVPQGTTCNQGNVEQIKVKDQKGNSAVTYIRST